MGKNDKKRGARGKFETWRTTDNLLLIESWARDGIADKDISSFIGITPQTFCKWQNAYPEIKEALHRGKRPVDFEVENALLKRALGYEKEDVIEFISIDGSGKKTKKITKKKTQVEPDTVACIFWLKNRKPKTWRNNKLPNAEEMDELARKKLVAEVEKTRAEADILQRRSEEDSDEDLEIEIKL